MYHNYPKLLNVIFKKDSFVEHHYVITESMYGFIPRQSTAMAVINLVESVTDAL